MANPLFGMRNNLWARQNQPGVTVPPVSGPNYNPYSTQSMPINSYQPTMQNQAPIMQAMQTMIPQSNMIWIDSVDEIPAYPTGRGWQQWFGDKNKPFLYVRETDANGIMQPIRTVRFSIENGEQTNVQEGEIVQEQKEDAATEQKVPDVPTREEFNAVVDSLRTISDQLKDLLK